MRELYFDEIVSMINELNMLSINICGSPGSGKSTLAEKLSKVLGFELYDLDSFFYRENCTRNSIADDKISLDFILSKNKFIIDGTYTSTIDYRIGKIDLFIFTKSSKWICLYRFIKRFISNKKLKCGERLTLKTLDLILNYKKAEQNLFNRLISNGNLIIYKDR